MSGDEALRSRIEELEKALCIIAWRAELSLHPGSHHEDELSGVSHLAVEKMEQLVGKESRSCVFSELDAERRRTPPTTDPIYEEAFWKHVRRVRPNPRKRVVIESPYAGDVAANVAYAKRCVLDCLARGEAPYASHLFFTQDGILNDRFPDERRLGMNAGFAWGEVAELVTVYTDLGVSKGMEEGIARAKEMRLPVEMRTLPATMLSLMESRRLYESGAWLFKTPKVERCERHGTWPQPDEPCWSCEREANEGDPIL